MASSSSDKSPSNAGQEDSGKVNWNWSGDDMKVNQSQTRKPSELKSSRAYSVASPAADKSRRAPLKANNPGSIPTAGGKALGVAAVEDRERRKSRMSSDMGALPLDKEGSPDAVTQNNTQSNTIPQRLAEENEEGSSKVEERPVSSPAPDVVVSNADGANTNAEDTPKLKDPFKADDASRIDETPKVDDAPKADDTPKLDDYKLGGEDKEKEDAVPPMKDSAPEKKENEPAPPSKERRGSRLDDVLGKLGLGSKKK